MDNRLALRRNTVKRIRSSDETLPSYIDRVVKRAL